MTCSLDIPSNLRVDKTGFGGVRIVQDPKRFCYGVDAVMLAGFAVRCLGRKRPGRICDLGTGNGIVPLILSHKTDADVLSGLEVQEENLTLARTSAELNGLTDRLFFCEGNVCDISPGSQLTRSLGGASTYDAVTANPPYMMKEGGLACSDPAKDIARREVLGGLEDFLAAAQIMLKPKGDFFLVHRPYRLTDILSSCRRLELEPKKLLLVSGHEGESPNILLLHCIRGGKPGMIVDSPIYVREKDGEFSHHMEEFYEFPEKS